MKARRFLLAGVAVLLIAAIRYGPAASFHLLPLAWTGEADRLASVLRLEAGDEVAEIGAGDGSMAVEIARRVGPTGRVYATEIDPNLRAAIAERTAAEGLEHVEVVAAAERDTSLASGCCDAVFMRNTLHHIADWSVYAARVAAALRSDARLAIIDFAPGTFLHLGRDHGADPEEVVAAFSRAGLKVAERNDEWGGGYYLLAFERD